MAQPSGMRKRPFSLELADIENQAKRPRLLNELRVYAEDSELLLYRTEATLALLRREMEQVCLSSDDSFSFLTFFSTAFCPLFPRINRPSIQFFSPHCFSIKLKSPSFGVHNLWTFNSESQFSLFPKRQ